MLTLLSSVIVQRDLDLQDMPQNITPIHYIHDIILIEQEQQVVGRLEAMVKCMHSRGWEFKFSGASPFSEVLRIQWS